MITTDGGRDHRLKSADCAHLLAMEFELRVEPRSEQFLNEMHEYSAGGRDNNRYRYVGGFSQKLNDLNTRKM